MGGAQPLAVTMNEGVALCVESTRPASSVASTPATSTGGRLAGRRGPRPSRPRPTADRSRSAWSATPPRWCPSCSAAGSRPTSSPTRPRRTTRWPTCPPTWPSRTGTPPATRTPRASSSRLARRWHPRRGDGRVPGRRRGGFDYGNSLRAEAELGGYERAFAYPGFVPAYIRPLFCEGKGPFRWVALSGDRRTSPHRRGVLELFPDNETLARWIRMAQEKVAFEGLPSRICWLGQGERDGAGQAFNELVADGRSAPRS